MRQDLFDVAVAGPLLFLEKHFFYHTTAEREYRLRFLFAEIQRLYQVHYARADVFCCLWGDVKLDKVSICFNYD